MIRNKYILLIVGAGLLACSSVREVNVSSDSINVIGDDPATNIIDEMVNPYKDSLKVEMSVVIAHAAEGMEVGRPNGRLNNWAADALLNQYQLTLLDAPTISLLNVGGLRNTINEGDITIGDIFTVMPFDNEVVIVKMPMSAKSDIVNYIQNSGGEPISGAFIRNDSLEFWSSTKADYFYVLTSDYLMNGGDKMNFFENKISFKYGKMLLRDVFIEAAKSQGELIQNNEERIFLE